MFLKACERFESLGDHLSLWVTVIFLHMCSRSLSATNKGMFGVFLDGVFKLRLFGLAIRMAHNDAFLNIVFNVLEGRVVPGSFAAGTAMCAARVDQLP